jgi:probable phosphoglycerate mutase
MVAGARDIADRHVGQRVVIVAHGGVLDSLFRYTLGIPLNEPRRCKLYNASINTVFVDQGIWMLGTWGDVHHLRDIGTQDDW